MIYCPTCGTANRDGSKFCNECGETLKSPPQGACPKCGKENAPGNAFCVYCGAALAAMPEPATAEETPPSPAPKVATPIIDQGDAPAWLTQLRAAATRESQIGEPEPAEEMAVEPPVPAPSEPVAPTGPALLFDEEETPPAATDTPDWLARWRAAAAETAGPIHEPAAPQPTPQPFTPTFREDVAGLPAWLSEAPDTPSESAGAPEMPDWLTQLRRQAVERPGDTSALIEESTRQTAPAFQTIPEPSTDLLPPIIPPEGAGALPAPVEEIAPEEPPAQIEPSSSALVMADEAAHPAPAPESAPPPDWLRELGPAPRWDEPVSAQGAPLPAAEIPDWLRPGALESGPAAVLAEDQSGLARADIPDWVQAMRPGARPRAMEAPALVTGEVGSSGVLQGLMNVIPIELPLAKPPDLAEAGSILTAVPPASEASQAFAQALAPALMAAAAPTAKTSLAPLWRILLALLLLLAVGAPLITNWAIITPNAVGDGLRAGQVGAIQDQIAALEANSAVLVAFDFDASMADEMRPLAETLVAHLLRRNVRVVAISLLPGGAPIASQVIAGVVEREMPAETGKNYVNLGYLTGQEAGLRAFAGDPFGANARDFDTGEPAAGAGVLAGVSTLDDLAMLIELGASQDTVRWWVEQVSTQTKTPIFAGVSAAAAPYVSPYASGGHAPLSGMLAGLPDAAMYARLAGIDAGLDSSIEALSWGVVAALLVIFVAVFAAPVFDREGGK
jgi:Meckel syndrome type 1 protein